ncbi:MAG: hypothetical protein O6852_01775 [Gammaproteobacteria bacterium]|nr:hypothetical protein [Gammaproteobacteria bacterium]
MHPVLIYAILCVALTVSLLFIFEAYQIGSIFFFLLSVAAGTAIIGKIAVKLLPADDPMQPEIEKEKVKLRANEYQREIQFIFNIVQPDPKLQPNTKRIAESLLECFDLSEEVMLMRLRQYFGDSFGARIDQPLPDFIEKIKKEFKDWVN